MPTKEYKSLDEAFQTLVDIEILDDEKMIPFARIEVPGLHSVEITMLSEYDYFYVLEPMRERLLNYYVNRIAATKNADSDELLERMKAVVNTIESCKTKEDVVKKSAAIAHLFDHHKEREYFFKCLKRLGIIQKWVKWKKYQQTVKPHITPVIFIFLWLFNFDGVKKNVICLIEKIGRVMKQHSSTELNYSTNWDDYKKRLSEASERNRKELGSWPGSNGRAKSEMTSS